LISGGLDSILAAKVIAQQGIEVIPLHFRIPFCHRSKGHDRLQAMVRENLGAELKSVELLEEYLGVIKNPRYGFGANMNPCIDCKILMLSKAKALMQELGVQFIVTGEVLGQRPMSQHKQALLNIAKRSGLEGLVVRPLSARLLPETIPETEGWIKRQALLNFSGRTRNPQIDLAESLEIKNYAQPAGGCLLTDPEFSRRLKELIEHEELTVDGIELLKVGRHFRIAANTKLVVGRDEEEDNQLVSLAGSGDYLFMPPLTSGPTSLGRGNFDPELVNFSCRITCRYCDKAAGNKAKIAYQRIPDKEEEIAEVLPADEEELMRVRI